MWPTLENRPSARGWTGPSGRTSGSVEAAPAADRERVVGTGLASLTQVQREVDGVGVLHPSQHSLALPPGGVGLVVVVGQEGCPVLQVLLAGIAQVTGLGDSGDSSLHAVLLGRSPTRVGSHHGHVEGGINKLRHAALRPAAFIRALVHGRLDTARHSRQHSQQRPQPPPGLQGQRGPPAARHPAARGTSSKAGVPRRTRLAACPEAEPPLRAEAGLWTGLEAASRTQSRWVGVQAKIPLPASAPPGALLALCADPRTSERALESAPQEEGAGGGVCPVGWDLAVEKTQDRPPPQFPRAGSCSPPYASSPATPGGSRSNHWLSGLEGGGPEKRNGRGVSKREEVTAAVCPVYKDCLSETSRF